MVIERGGLLYPIEVRDLFSQNLRRFRDEINAARKDFATFRRTAVRTSRDSAQAETAARRQQANAAKDEAKAERERLRTIAAVAAQRKRQEAEISRIVRQARRDADARRKAEERAAAAQLKSNLAASKAAAAGGGNQLRLRREVERTNRAASQLTTTFRNLVGVFAVFQLARAGSRAFTSLVRSGLEFNQTIESSRLGLAGIITSTAKVVDEQDRVVEGAEAFNVALDLARQQQKQLQRDALRTTATYEELLKVFQIATGPGLAQGLNLDQIRQLSVLISQAAAAIDLPQNQLSEEIRALLTGNIRATTTRIAQVLNLTNADIRNAQSQGQLFEFLRNRLDGFSLAAEQAANTVGGLAKRIGGALQVIAGEAAASSFGTLQEVLTEVFESLLDIERNADGAIEAVAPSPEVVAVFQSIFDALEKIVQRARALGRGIGFEGLSNAAQLFATALEIAGSLLVEVAAGAVRGFSTLQTILSPIVDSFFRLRDILNGLFGPGTVNAFLSGIGQMLTVAIGLRIAFVGVTGTVQLLLGIYPRLLSMLGSSLLAVNNIVEGTKLWVAESKIGAATWKIITSRAALFAGSFAGLVSLAKLFLETILDVELEFKDLPELLGSVFENVFAQIIALGDVLLETVSGKAKEAFIVARNAVLDTLDFISRQLDIFRGDDSIQQKEREREAAALKRQIELAKIRQQTELAVAEAKGRAAQIEQDADKRQADRINRVRREAELRGRLASEIEKQISAESRKSSAAAPGVPGGSAGPLPREVTDQERDKLQDLQRQIGLRQTEVLLRQQITEISKSQSTAAQKEVEIIGAQLRALDAKKSLQQEIGRDAVERFERDRKQDLDSPEGSDARNQAQRELLALKGEQRLKEAEIADEIGRQQEGLRVATLIAEGSIGEGLGQGLASFADDFSSAFLAGLDIARGALDAFAGYVTKSITDALDPNANSDTHRENFGRFLQQISAQIIETLTRLAIAKALLALPGLGAADGGQVPGLGFAEGGRVPRRARRAGRSHARARGYARGGGIRPRNLDPRDTVPIWTQPGEWVISLGAVRKYGSDFMDQLNRGILDPSGLRNAIQAGRTLSPRRRARIGYATGGEVISQAAAGARQVQEAAQGGGGQLTVLPTLVADNASLERLLSGGRQAMLGFLKDNAPEVESLLARNRRS